MPDDSAARTAIAVPVSRAGIAWRFALIGGLAALTVPPVLSPMGAGLDGSWVVALNLLAAGDRFQFGRDVAFTYGPLGFALKPLDIGPNLGHAIGLRLALTALWWASVAGLLMRVRGAVRPLLFLASASYAGIQFDGGYDWNSSLSNLMLASIVGFVVLAYDSRRLAWAWPGVVVAAVALLAKFNVGFVGAGAIGLWGLLELRRDRSTPRLRGLATLAAAYLATLLLLFRIYGGPLGGFPAFLASSARISKGFSLQMASEGPPGEVLRLSAIMIGVAAWASVGLARSWRAAPALAIALLPIFGLYKGSIVRHDSGHLAEYACGIPALVAMALVGGREAGRRAELLRSAAAAAVLLAVGSLLPMDPGAMLTKGAHNAASLADLGRTRAEIRRIDDDLRASLRLPPGIRERIGAETVDVFPWDLSLVSANGLNWRPRYALQSYNAYAPALDRVGARLYGSADGPRFVLYSHAGIGSVGRGGEVAVQHPTLVDSRTWLELFRCYDVVDQRPGLTLMQRRGRPRWDPGEARVLGSRTIGFGERWGLPTGVDGPVVARARFELAPLSKLRSYLFKVEPPGVRVEYLDGSTRVHQLVWQNAGGGFLASDLPVDEAGVRSLFGEGEADPVRSLTFVGGDDFRPEIALSWAELPRAPEHHFVEVGLPVEPASIHQMGWDPAESRGEGDGEDPHLVFRLDRPAFVGRITLHSTFGHPTRGLVPVTVFWRIRGRDGYSYDERSRSVFAPTGQGHTISVPVFDEIDEFRIDLEDPASSIRLHRIVAGQRAEIEATADEGGRPVR
ncbi:hypothetical protein [Tautonia plasticadhaerens]|uniref:Uncharacterized protein n=1 Tax=Tautonia plasticadhaerens TaxID=2527974 RepID=A0A518HC64_9BACT|nr:hypothetical protein [Tautonia plasticadhaerens]QDV38452.1 hypothetical protein ElP_64070 [Tautonia plasticadhaerens]